MQHKKLVQRFEGANEDKLKCAAICTKQKKLLITGGADANVSIWLLSKLEPITILRGQKSAITCLTSHPNESYIAGGSVDGTIKIWDLAQNGKAVRTFGCAEGTGCVGIQFHPLVDILAVMSSNFSVHLWDFRQRRCIKQIPAVLFQGKEKRKQSLSILPCLQFSPDGKWFCYSSISEESTLHVWDLSSGKEIQALAHPIEEGLICSLVFHPRHMIMITGTQAGNIRVWDMSSFRNLCTFAPLQTLSDESQPEDGVRMIFNAEGNVLFVYKGNWMERLYCSPEDLFNLHSIDTIRSECKTIPHHLVLSGTSLLSICCDSSSAFSLWVTNATLDRKDIPNPNEPSEVAEELTETYEQPPTLPVLPKNQKILVDRQNSPFALDIQSFCSDILSDCEIRGTSEEKALAELTGDSHKQFIAAMNGRLRVVKPLQNLTKKSDIPGILNLFARMKDIDLAILAVSIDSCLPSLEKATLQLEHLNSFNSLLLLLLRSAENRYIATALQCLTKLVVTYGNILNRSNKLRESLQQSQQLAQDANQPMPTRIAARGACRAFKSAR